MTTAALLIFIPACFALNLSPGPNNLFAMTTATKHGTRIALFHEPLGRLLAFVLMITFASLGLVAVLHTSEVLFLVIKIVGALYLFYIAWQLWNSSAMHINKDAKPTESLLKLAQHEFMLAAGNPKAILIFTAFLPQFVDASEPVASQFMVVGSMFLILEWIAVLVYALAGSLLGPWLQSSKRQMIFNRLSATLLSGAGVGLLLSSATD